MERVLVGSAQSPVSSVPWGSSLPQREVYAAASPAVCSTPALTIPFQPCWSPPTSTPKAPPGSGVWACRRSSTVCQNLPSCWRCSSRPPPPVHGDTGSWSPAGWDSPTHHHYSHGTDDRSTHSHRTVPRPRWPVAEAPTEEWGPCRLGFWQKVSPYVCWAAGFIQLLRTCGFQMWVSGLQLQCVIV